MSAIDLDALRDAVPVRNLAAADAARSRLAMLAAPPGSLGRLAGLATWLCGAQGVCPPTPLSRVRVLVFAGGRSVVTVDHAGALAQLYGASVRVLDRGLDLALDTGSTAERAGALSAAELHTAVEAGRAIADEEVDAGSDLLVASGAGAASRDVAAVLVGAALGLEALDVVGTGAGLDDAGWAARVSVVRDGVFRARGLAEEPLALLRSVGTADAAALTGFLLQSAVRRTPVLLDGTLACACALLARRLVEGAAQWWLAADRSSDAAQHRALAALGLEPLLELGLDLDDGSGALIALPVLRAAQLLLAETPTIDALQLTPPVDDDAT